MPEKNSEKIKSLEDLRRTVEQWKFLGKSIVFTNGCFDILHKGHIHSLSEAAKQGDKLIVGLNSDSSTKKLKGANRPVNEQDARALLLSSLLMVDAVTIFDEETPEELIKAINPDVLVKGGDYSIDQIAGASHVIARGGKVITHTLIDGISTTALLSKSSTTR